MNPLQSKAISWLRFPLIVLIVYIHRTGGYDVGPELRSVSTDLLYLSRADCFVYLKIFSQQVFPRVAVPSFFVISGYLFFTNIRYWSWDIYLNKVSKRIKTLLIPYLLWNVIALSYPVSLYLIRDVPLPDSIVGWLSYFWDAGDGLSQPLDYPLWYVRDLMIVTLLSPLWYLMLKFLGLFFVAVLVVLYVLGIIPTVPGLSITAVTFYCIGAYLSVHGQLMSFGSYKKVNYLVSLLLLLLSVYSYGTEFYGPILMLYTLSGTASVFNLSLYVVEKGLFEFFYRLNRYTFFIYATHALVFVFVWDIAMYGLTSHSSFPVQLVVYMMLPLAKIAFCVFLYSIMDYFFPVTLKVLVGKR